MSSTQISSSRLDTSESSKVTISSLLRNEDLPHEPTKGARCRVNRACVYCRAQKVKCDGARPKCTRCIANEAGCVYAPSRKEKLKSITKRNQEMILLLRELRGHVSADDAQKIEELLADVYSTGQPWRLDH
ncbi:hypothetical protein BS50DRAFT_128707 [Corynespora cassiicola Philippines]|uniref:Zn(2)-C6 fungal-type domain-containing protein n=1 Tax=Corynespora cassiicola Philippines TaxID=1448308 RepID=A0A2T2NBE4_CORCC|nr:hypothetical protein BS50DRAFT_128707 [Corynespora cassiicola Philippines]